MPLALKDPHALCGEGLIYLLHFDRPFKHARHYMGFTDNLGDRLERHARGDGSKLLRAIVAAGITWKLVAVWRGDRTAERKIKRLGGLSRVCPKCKAERDGRRRYDEAQADNLGSEENDEETQSREADGEPSL